MNTTINWAADFQFNEPLHEGARTIYTTYGRLGIKYPDHADYAKWDKLETEWINYERTISDLPLTTKELAEVEVTRVLAKAKEVHALEDGIDKEMLDIKKKN